MIKISINGKVLNREFQNMAQALAFAYSNGECYGGKVVELAQEGAGNSGGTSAVGGFTQEDIDIACQSIAAAANEEIVALEEQLKTKDAEIAELKNQIAAKELDIKQDNPDEKATDPTPVEDPKTDPVTTDPTAAENPIKK